MTVSRRSLLFGTAGMLCPTLGRLVFGHDPLSELIIDTHQHLWDLSWQTLPWLQRAAPVLRRSYTTADYLQATGGLNVKTVYMEVDVDPTQLDAEVDKVVEYSRSPAHPTIAAVVGGRPANPGFPQYLRRLKQFPEVKGVRQVLHGGGTPRGYCLGNEFTSGIDQLGKEDLSFDLCLRPSELADGAELASRCPGVRFVLDHCGNADPKAFDPQLAGDARPSHDADQWRRDIERLAKQPHVICKISGIVARAPQGWRVEHLAPIVNHCWDAFGPDRVVFGGDWPVCLVGAPLRNWIAALQEIAAERPQEQQRKLWADNALNFYRLTVS